MLVADLRHFLDLPDDVPTAAVRLADQLRGIVRAATAGDAGAHWVTALPCQRRPGRRRCPGRIRVRRTDAPAPITWECTACGDSGSIGGWPGTSDDLSGQRLSADGPARDIRVSEHLAASLRESWCWTRSASASSTVRGTTRVRSSCPRRKTISTSCSATWRRRPTTRATGDIDSAWTPPTTS